MAGSEEESDARFRVYRQFNEGELAARAGEKRRLHAFPRELFAGDELENRLARSLAEHRVIHLKELLESFEFFVRVRRRVRRPTVVDLCAGHGLTGLLFAMCERSVERVLLIDERLAPTQARVLAAVVAVAPWVAEKVETMEASLEDLSPLPADCGVVMVHACGGLTDQGLALAIAAGGPVAAMPCCYDRADQAMLPGLRRALGHELACDIARSYRLSEAGYQVDWSEVPRAITPKRRILIGWSPRG